ncbi:hypothetical protein AAK894_13305 [Lachnospiraceae bacterium 46-61]
MNFKKKLQAAMPKMIGNPMASAMAMASVGVSTLNTKKGQKPKNATKGKKKVAVKKSKIVSKKQKKQMEVMKRICQSAYGTYIRGVTTVSARYIGHPAVAIPASEMIKTMMEEAAPPVSRPFVTITSEQMNSLKIEERKGEKEYIKTKDKSEERERLPFSKPIRDMGLLWNRMWGYEDDAPVAGQPFYDIVELYGDFKRATNDFSDYLEKEINDWAKGLDEDYKNRELAKPASMRSDFGDAITGLTSGKEDNLSFGGKAGAFLRGLIVDGCGKLLIKDTLLAASSPCDTAKSVMETVKLVEDMDEEDFSKIAKEIKTTWDEASEEEKLNYTGQAGAIVADFLIAKKLKLSKQVKVVETGVTAGSKVDNLLEAGAKASSKADDITEAGTKVISKVDDIAEIGVQAGSKADDVVEAGAKASSKANDATKAGAKANSKADDVAEAGAQAGSKADDIVEAGAKANSKANDTAKAAGQTTALTVVKDNSGTNGSGVKISGEKPNSNIDDIRTKVIESNSMGKDKISTSNAVNETKVDNTESINEIKTKWWHKNYVDNLSDTQILLGVKQSEKGLSTLGSATRENVMFAGKAWVGNSYKEILDTSGNLIGYSSSDGMRAFRIQYKPKEGMWRANFQENVMVNNPYPNPGQHSSQLKNVHIDILD